MARPARPMGVPSGVKGGSGKSGPLTGTSQWQCFQRGVKPLVRSVVSLSNRQATCYIVVSMSPAVKLGKRGTIVPEVGR